MKKYLKIIWKYYALSVLVLLISTSAISITFTIPGIYIDNYNKGSEYFIKTVVTIIVAFFVYIIAVHIDNYIASLRGRDLQYAMQKDFFETVINKSYEDFYSKNIEEYISIQANELLELRRGYFSSISGIIYSTVLFVVYGSFLIYFVDIRVALFILAISFLSLLSPKITSNWVSKLKKQYFDQLEIYTSKVSSLFKGFDVLDRKSRLSFIEKHQETLDVTVEKSFKHSRADMVAMVINGGSCESIRVWVFIFAAYLLFRGELTVGAVVIALSYGDKLVDPVHQLTLCIGQLKASEGIKLKVIKFLNSTKDMNEEISSFENIIQIENVGKDFDKFSMNRFNFEVKPSGKYLIHGDNGTGKSTLLKVMMQFIKEYDGQILVDSTNVKDKSIEQIFTYVPQNGYIIEDATYSDNVSLYGTYSLEKLSEYENMFPENVINKIKERKLLNNLSGGEKQVVSLLRALCSGKEVLILDEPFSAMSKVVFDEIFANLLKTNRTIVVVMHNEIKDFNVFTDVVHA